MNLSRWQGRWLAALGSAGLLLATAAGAQEAYDGAVVHEAPKPPPAPVLTRAPQLLKSVEPVYPEEARARKLSGDVALQLEIGEDGAVREATVEKGAGQGFDEAALAAVRQFVFSPAEVDGKPAPIRIEYVQHFAFQEPPPPPPAAPPEPPITLTGRVLERGNRKPIAGATVRASTLAEPVTTDADGAFALRLPPGPVALELLDSDHEPFHTRETVKPGERLEGTYYLMPRQIGLNETIVRGEREKKEVTRRTLTREELEKVPGSFGDPLRVLQDLPGVARAPFASGALIVRGASPSDTGTYVDGVQLPLLYHFAGGPSVLNPEYIDKIDFYPGGFGAEYGRAIGGIVDVSTRPVTDKQWHGSAKIDLIDTGLYLAAPVAPGLNVSAAARRSFIDAILPLFLRGSNTLISPSYYDYQARVDFHPEGSRHSFQLFGIGSDDLLTAVVGRGGSASVSINDHTGFQRLVAGWQYRGDALTQKLQVFVGRNVNSLGLATLRLDQNDGVGGFRERLEWTARPWLTLRGGLDVQLTRSTVTAYAPPPAVNYRAFPGERPESDPVASSVERDTFPYAEWLEGQLSFGGLKIFPGLRAEQYRVGGQWRKDADPRLVIRQELGPKEHATVLKGSVGLYHEAPSPQTLDPVTGNPELPLQAAFQSSVGIEQKLTDTINIDVTGFYNRRYNLAERTGAVVTLDDGTLKRLNYDSIGLGRAYGMEVFLRHELTAHFFGWVAYTLSWSEERNKGDAAYHWATYDQRHILTVIGQYKFGNGWELGGRFRLTTGDPSTPYVGSTFDADTQTYSPIPGAVGSTRERTFQQLDLRVDRTWVFDLWTLGVYLDVQNVYNYANQEAVQNDYRYRTQQIITGLPFLPTLGVKGSF